MRTPCKVLLRDACIIPILKISSRRRLQGLAETPSLCHPVEGRAHDGMRSPTGSASGFLASIGQTQGTERRLDAKISPYVHPSASAYAYATVITQNLLPIVPRHFDEAQYLMIFRFARSRRRILRTSHSFRGSRRVVIGQVDCREKLTSPHRQEIAGQAVVASWHGKACQHSQFVLRILRELGAYDTRR